MKIGGRWMSCASLALLLAGSAVAGIKTWQVGSGNWSDGANWAGGVPGAGDDVFITNASANVLLAASTPALTSLTLSGKLVCTNWSTSLQAQSVSVATGGLITLPNAFSETQMSNRVWIVCSNLTVQTNGSIDATGKGYAGGYNGSAGYGPGKGLGSTHGSGAGYGGLGGCSDKLTGGPAYGDPADPMAPGSGGGTHPHTSGKGGAGGGAIRVEAHGDVIIDGAIAVNGTDANYHSGGGSGGAVVIHCHRFGGDGFISANGGKLANTGGGGGGGRVAVNYDLLMGTPAVRIEAREGDSLWPMWGPHLRWSQYRWCAAPGTLYFSDTEILGSVITNLYGELHVPNFSSWAPAALTVSNALVRFKSGFDLRVTGELVVGPNGALELMSDSYLQVGNDLRLNGGRLVMNVFTQANFLANLDVSQGGLFYAFSGPTNGIEAAGACVNVAGDIHIGKSSWIIPEANGTNGGPVRFRARNVQIATGGGFDADGRGFLGAWFTMRRTGCGPGGAGNGSHGAGGGYGGRGGDSGNWSAIGGSNYGISNAFLQAGSGGGNWDQATGGHGGGLVWIEAMETMRLDGVLSADGGAAGAWSGGGSGGGVFIMTPRFSGGAAAVLRANGSGGVNDGGPGGGGRIVVALGFDDAARQALVEGTPVAGLHAYTHHAGYEGATVAAAGTTGANYTGREERAPQSGTCVFLTTNTTFYVTGTPGNFGHPVPYGYGTYPYYTTDAWVTNRVMTPDDEAAGLRHACLGWTLEDASGNFVAADTTPEAVFQLTAPHVLTWKWTNEYYLAIQQGPDGNVTTERSGWYTNATVIANIAATANAGYVFDRWVGNFPEGGETVNPLTVTMDQPRTLTPVFASVAGLDKDWNGGIGNWEEAGNWAPPGMPGLYDRVTITSGTAIINLPRHAASVTISDQGVLLFTNWVATLNASNVTVASGGLVTLPPAFTDDGMSNRVWIVCTNLTVQVGGSINVTGKGYAGSPSGTAGFGPGKGIGIKYGGGGGYGGAGGCGIVAGGSAYGDAADPLLPGSGGGAYTDPPCKGGAGGGVVRIEAAGDVLIAGTIAANGTAAIHYSGGGSGGAVAIHCRRFGGDGLITANGGAHANAGGGGGGGRIAINYDSLMGTPAVHVEAREGTSPWPMWDHTLRWSEHRWCAAPGTLYFSDTSFLSQVVTNLYGELHLPNFFSWAPATLAVSNALLRFQPGFDLRVAGELIVGPNGALELMSDSYLRVGGDLRLKGGRLVMNVFTQANVLADLDVSQGGRFYACSGSTKGVEGAGACVDVVGDIRIGKSSWIIPEANGTNGAPVRFRARNVQIAADGGFNADGRGFLGAWFDVQRAGYGPGGAYASGFYGAGGGYGGRGGDAWGDFYGATWGPIGGFSYGVSNAPPLAGSGGSNWASDYGGHGGGLVWIEAKETVRLDGILSANGGTAGGWSGGGSGGGIFIVAPRFSGGAVAVLRANGSGGGASGGGSGGGGRIVVAVGLTAAERDRLMAGQGRHRYVEALDIPHAGTVEVNVGSGAGASYTSAPEHAPQAGSACFLKTLGGTLLLLR